MELKKIRECENNFKKLTKRGFQIFKFLEASILRPLFWFVENSILFNELN